MFYFIAVLCYNRKHGSCRCNLSLSLIPMDEIIERGIIFHLIQIQTNGIYTDMGACSMTHAEKSGY